MKKRKRVKERRATLKQCDDLARELCRKRRVCEAHLTPFATNEAGEITQCSGYLQWAHIVSRTYKWTRWRRDNCFLLCAAHHLFFTYRPVHWERFVVSKMGPKAYERLKLDAYATGFPKDYSAILESLRQYGTWPAGIIGAK
jgi:hypothetical protein